MREGGEDDGKGMVSDVEGVWSLGGREMLSSMRDGICVCLCGGGGGGNGIDGSSGGGVVGGSGGSCGVADSGESVERIVYRSGGVWLYRSG